ncbi:MAG TPA: DNA-binding response regulator [Cytophagales bacterium]|nr:DNA-binding response regulator [Cytophagales bacterium]HAA19011.1 DNA-binding response regulator [Cytophagales bacterium]HAP61813.1 DNA-binding response regulator [Cytophagales bacterium]
MSLRTVIIDDETPAREVIKLFIKDHPELEVVGEAENGFDGLRMIQELTPDLIFLDIQMPKLTGFELLELLDQPPRVIFSTTYDEYAVKAFQVHAVDYLLKPYNRARFAEAVGQVLSQPQQDTPTPTQATEMRETAQSGYAHQVVVKDGTKITIIPVTDIIRIAAQDDYSEIITAERKHLKKQTMTQFEKMLDPTVFVRVHRSSIVQVSHIAQLDKYGKETHLAVLRTGDEVVVSATGFAKLKEVLEW